MFKILAITVNLLFLVFLFVLVTQLGITSKDEVLIFSIMAVVPVISIAALMVGKK
jgi:hypothetical protein